MDTSPPSLPAILSKIVMKSLRMAESDSEKSIAFPAIGTGNLGFPKDKVAKIMIEQVLDFAERVYKGSKLDVFFVLYPPDQGTVKHNNFLHLLIGDIQVSHYHKEDVKAMMM
ncbi:Poly [ADP-ribose] polymerase 14 [Acipenser ruthenus]|uniref:Poly [ADP-ribose] polymerase 14 n=1 Tax=Acipenser ruthenus TaxID=7906 RepID=A0A444UFL6_ACIRT|nr:Poly [ADP-ribose] polymerase 14 [Acipenser ruthenus]